MLKIQGVQMQQLKKMKTYCCKCNFNLTDSHKYCINSQNEQMLKWASASLGSSLTHPTCLTSLVVQQQFLRTAMVKISAPVLCLCHITLQRMVVVCLDSSLWCRKTLHFSVAVSLSPVQSSVQLFPKKNKNTHESFFPHQNA